jgi:hypothetical protein
MERYLVELDGDQIELLMGMVREPMKVADENKIPELEALLSALGIMSWKAGDRRSDWSNGAAVASPGREGATLARPLDGAS